MLVHVTGTVEIYTLSRYLCRDGLESFELVSCTWIWEPFLSCLCAFS